MTELKDKAPEFANVDPAVVRLSGDIEDRRAPRPVAMPCLRWSISVMASRRLPPLSPLRNAKQERARRRGC